MDRLFDPAAETLPSPCVVRAWRAWIIASWLPDRPDRKVPRVLAMGVCAALRCASISGPAARRQAAQSPMLILSTAASQISTERNRKATFCFLFLASGFVLAVKNLILERKKERKKSGECAAPTHYAICSPAYKASARPAPRLQRNTQANAA